MKNNNVKKIAGRTKLFSAIGMFTVSAVMLASSTYAWFTMNKDVKVTGMELKTKVSGNLLISATNVENTYSSDTLAQTRQALLEPVSSTTGQTGKFFYTLDAAADGHKIHDATSAGNAYVAYSEAATKSDTAADKSAYDAIFNTNYGITTAATDGAWNAAYGYVDYTFYLKATSDAATQQLRMTRCNMVRNYVADGESEAADHVLDDANDAWRVAVFASELPSNDTHAGAWATDPAAAPESPAATAKTILTPDGAANFTSNKAVASTTATDTVTYNTGAVIDTIATAGTTKYYKVVVRVWLEGEDTSCYSEYYAPLSEAYKLDLMFELGKGTAVTNIGSTLNPATPASAGA